MILGVCVGDRRGFFILYSGLDTRRRLNKAWSASVFVRGKLRIQLRLEEMNLNQINTTNVGSLNEIINDKIFISGKFEKIEV